MPTDPAPSDRTPDYRDAAAFRTALRGFLHRSEELAARHGLTPPRQLLLLLIKGAPDGSERATVTDLAARMYLARNTVTELAARAEEAGLISRERSPHDARSVLLGVTPEGERRLAATVRDLQSERRALAAVVRLTAAHLDGADGPPHD